MKFKYVSESADKWYTLCNGQDLYVHKSLKDFCSSHGIENKEVDSYYAEEEPVTFVYKNDKVYSSNLDGTKIPSLKNVICAFTDDRSALYVYGDFKLHDIENDEYFNLKDALKLPKCTKEERFFTIVEDE